jgi:4-amino-4-deoxy-L-arabinose transferase-like glycosyltransferase
MGKSLTYLTLGDFSDTLVYRLAYRWRQFIIAFSILIVFIFAVAILGPQARAEPYSDQAYYLVVAKSISQGTGLSLISHPEEPLATVAPPGYPILLSGLVKIFGLESTFPYRLLNTFFWLGLIVLIGVLVGQEDGRVWGLFIALLIALNVHIIGFANAILTELPYTFFSIVAIILTYKYIKSVGPRRWIWLIPIIITLSFLPYLRMIAVSLVAAVVLYLIVPKLLQYRSFICNK